MARPLRIEYPGAWYHVMHRGAGKRQTFLSDCDYDRFLDLLGDIHEMWKVEVHAYCLMGNHYHLLLHTPAGSLSRAMRHVDGVYTQRFNRAHKTDGPLFRGRFKSIIIEKDEYLLELIRYIHLNPVRAGLVKEPSDYRLTSHLAYMRSSLRPEWLVVDEVLSQFGKRRSEAVRRFNQFVSAGSPARLEQALGAGKLPSILGSKVFKDWIRYNFVDRLKKDREIPEARRVSRRLAPPESVIKAVAFAYGVSRSHIRRIRRGTHNEAREMAIYLMRRVGGAGYIDIGKIVGGMNAPAVAQSIRRFRSRIDRNRPLREKSETIAKHILSLVKT